MHQPLLPAVLLSPSNKNFQHYDVGLQHKRVEINGTKPSGLDHFYDGIDSAAQKRHCGLGLGWTKIILRFKSV